MLRFPRRLRLALPVLFWILILLPIPALPKLLCVSLILVACDIEFTYLLVIIAGFFKVWGNVASLNQIIDLTLLAAVILLARLLLGLLSSKNVRIGKLTGQFVFYLAIFESVMLLSLFYTLDITNGLNKASLFIFITNLIILAPIISGFTKERTTTNFLFYLLLHATAFSIVAILQGTSTIFMTDYIMLGRISGLGVLLALALLGFNARRRNWLILRRYLGMAFIMINSWGLLLSGSRGPAFSLIVAIALLGVLIRKKTGEVFKYLAWVAITVFLVFGLVELKILPGTAYHRIALTIGQEENVLGARSGLFENAIEMFMSNPVLGKGIGSYGVYVSNIRGWNSYSHNIVLEIAAELGLLGLLAFSAVLYIALKKSLRLLNIGGESRLVYGAISIFAFSLLNSLISGDLNSNKFLWCGLGLLFSTIFYGGASTNVNQ